MQKNTVFISSESLVVVRLCFSGESATHYLVKNTVKTFKELGVNVALGIKYTHKLCAQFLRLERGCVVMILQVLKERRENRVTMLELSSTFLPQANRNKLLQYILGFTLM